METNTNTGAVLIHSTRLVGNRVAYSAWEPSSYTGKHGTLMTIEGRVFGKIGTREIPEELKRFPGGSVERIEAVRSWYNAQKEEAYAAIVAAHPETREGWRDGTGEIELVIGVRS